MLYIQTLGLSDWFSFILVLIRKSLFVKIRQSINADFVIALVRSVFRHFNLVPKLLTSTAASIEVTDLVKPVLR